MIFSDFVDEDGADIDADKRDLTDISPVDEHPLEKYLLAGYPLADTRPEDSQTSDNKFDLLLHNNERPGEDDLDWFAEFTATQEAKHPESPNVELARKTPGLGEMSQEDFVARLNDKMTSIIPLDPMKLVLT